MSLNQSILILLLTLPSGSDCFCTNSPDETWEKDLELHYEKKFNKIF